MRILKRSGGRGKVIWAACYQKTSASINRPTFFSPNSQQCEEHPGEMPEVFKIGQKSQAWPRLFPAGTTELSKKVGYLVVCDLWLYPSWFLPKVKMLLKIFPKYTLTISITSESRVPNASKKIVFSQKNSWRRACLMEAPVSGTSTAFHPPREFLFSRLFAPRNYPKLMFIIPPRVFVALPGEKWLDINLTARLLGNMLCQIVYIISAFPSLNPDLRMTVMRITNQVWN